jgi:hypothetical protein
MGKNNKRKPSSTIKIVLNNKDYEQLLKEDREYDKLDIIVNALREAAKAKAKKDLEKNEN